MMDHEPRHTDCDVSCTACDWYSGEPSGRTWWEHLPAAPAEGLREAAERVVGRFLDTPASLAGVHVAALNDLRAALTPEEPT